MCGGVQEGTEDVILVASHGRCAHVCGAGERAEGCPESQWWDLPQPAPSLTASLRLGSRCQFGLDTPGQGAPPPAATRFSWECLRQAAGRVQGVAGLDPSSPGYPPPMPHPAQGLWCQDCTLTTNSSHCTPKQCQPSDTVCASVRITDPSSSKSDSRLGWGHGQRVSSEPLWLRTRARARGRLLPCHVTLSSCVTLPGLSVAFSVSLGKAWWIEASVLLFLVPELTHGPRAGSPA